MQGVGVGAGVGTGVGTGVGVAVGEGVGTGQAPEPQRQKGSAQGYVPTPGRGHTQGLGVGAGVGLALGDGLGCGVMQAQPSAPWTQNPGAEQRATHSAKPAGSGIDVPPQETRNVLHRYASASAGHLTCRSSCRRPTSR
jgi:hypothetical protein